MLPDEVITVSDFISLFNQTLEYAYPIVVIEGELANLRISKNKWLYFDLKDENSTLKFFGTVYNMHWPLENGMLLKVSCYPKLHNLYGLSMQIQAIELSGEGSIKRSAVLLEQKLRLEGLFYEDKKRPIPYPPQKIGLITSSQSAAYADFVKIINSRWQGIEIDLIDVQVQGEIAITQIATAIEHFNKNSNNYEALVVIRGGGSPEDLAAFSSEAVTRAVAGSLVPTLVAIGHEIDVSLAELAADYRASTPSNAAELLVPDRKTYVNQLNRTKTDLKNLVLSFTKDYSRKLKENSVYLQKLATSQLEGQLEKLNNRRQLLNAYNPESVLSRGYAVVRKLDKIVYSAQQLSKEDKLEIRFAKGSASAVVKGTKRN
jgi:exodeoxyribonuclease VII large subunit